eukprot:17104-Heterococcus_DN1.PRE.3
MLYIAPCQDDALHNNVPPTWNVLLTVQSACYRCTRSACTSHLKSLKTHATCGSLSYRHLSEWHPCKLIPVYAVQLQLNEDYNIILEVCYLSLSNLKPMRAKRTTQYANVLMSSSHIACDLVGRVHRYYVHAQQ